MPCEQSCLGFAVDRSSLTARAVAVWIVNVSCRLSSAKEICSMKFSSRIKSHHSGNQKASLVRKLHAHCRPHSTRACTIGTCIYNGEGAVLLSSAAFCAPISVTKNACHTADQLVSPKLKASLLKRMELNQRTDRLRRCFCICTVSHVPKHRHLHAWRS